VRSHLRPQPSVSDLGYAYTDGVSQHANEVVADEQGRFCALPVQDDIRVIDLRHAQALSPAADAFYQKPVVEHFRDDGGLTVLCADHRALAEGGRIVLSEALPPRMQLDAASLAFGPLVVCGQDSGQVQVWNSDTTHLLREVASDGAASSLSISPHQRYLCCKNAQGDLCLSDLEHARTPTRWLCHPSSTDSFLMITWSHDERTCFVCEVFSGRGGGMLDATDLCIGAWDCESLRRRWTPRDEAGAELHSAWNMAESPDGRTVLIEQFNPGAIGPHGPRPPPRMLRARDYQRADPFQAFLVDAQDGHWLRRLDSPGAAAEFTPDGRRVAGANAVVRVADGRLLQEVPPPRLRQVRFSPSHTWMAVVRPDTAFDLTDVAGAGVHVSLPVTSPPLSSVQLARMTWDAEERHLALSFSNYPCVLEIDLFPPCPPAADLTVALTQLEGEADWLHAACALAGAGEGAVTLLTQGTLSAHRVIALGECAHGGSASARAALLQLSQAETPLGYLASDCLARLSLAHPSVILGPPSP